MTPGWMGDDKDRRAIKSGGRVRGRPVLRTPWLCHSARRSESEDANHAIHRAMKRRSNMHR